MRYDLDSQPAEPDPSVRWTCPRCGRLTVELGGDLRVTGRVCAGHPVLGTLHSPTAMTRTPMATVAETSTPADPSTRFLSVAEQLERQARPRYVMPLLEPADVAQLAEQLRGQGTCAHCGPLVEVDNPVRREPRHRRGCPTQEA